MEEIVPMGNSLTSCVVNVMACRERRRTVALRLQLMLWFAPVFVIAPAANAQLSGVRSGYRDYGSLNERKQPPSSSGSVLSKVGQWGWGPCYSVAVEGNYAYISNGSTFQVLDVSDPSKPKPIGQLNDPVSRIEVSGNYAYVISPFQIIDISNPYNPTIVSTFPLPSGYPATALTVKGQYAYVGDLNGNIMIINISNPSIPKEVGGTSAAGEVVRSLAVYDTTMYESDDEQYGIGVFDISNPSSPSRATIVPGDGSDAPLAVEGNYLYTGIHGVLVFDLSNPLVPRYVNSFKADSGSLVCSISVVDTLAFASLNNGKLQEVDIADTSSIHLVSSLEPEFSGFGEPLGGIASFPYAYIASGTGLWIIDISKPRQMSTASFFPTGWYVNRIALDSSNHAFLAELYGGLKIIDYSDPSSPKLVGEYSPGERVIDVAVADDFAYLVCDSDFQVLDVVNRASPKLIGRVPFNDTITTTQQGNFDFVCVNDTTVYAARKSQKLFAVDVKDPTSPRIVSSVPLEGIPVGISQSDGYLYVGEAFLGMQIFSLDSVNLSLQAVGFISSNDLSGLSAQGNFIFASDSGGFSEYDLSDPLNPAWRYSLTIPNGIQTVDIAPDDGYAYVAYNNTFMAINILNPDSGKISYLQNSVSVATGKFNAVAASAGLAITGYDGIVIFKNLLTGIKTPHEPVPSDFNLFQNFPNPFNPSTNIGFHLVSACHVRLDVYNVLGERLMKKNLGLLGPGIHEEILEMPAFPSGVYFYRIEAVDPAGETYESVKKMELLK